MRAWEHLTHWSPHSKQPATRDYYAERREANVYICVEPLYIRASTRPIFS